jgi:hypothetical protein
VYGVDTHFSANNVFSAGCDSLMLTSTFFFSSVHIWIRPCTQGSDVRIIARAFCYWFPCLRQSISAIYARVTADLRGFRGHKLKICLTCATGTSLAVRAV